MEAKVKIKKIKIVSLTITVLIGSVMLYLILQPNAFNFLPYLLYQTFIAEYNEKGESLGFISEHQFIVVFDILFVGLLLLLIYRLITVLISKYVI